ncbi:unnamed protein product [Rotaria magnacalcarata]
MHHLPYQCSKLFWLIKSVLKVIFNSTNYLFSWGNAKSELNELIPYGLLTSERLRLINDIDIQKNFRNWHNNMLKQKCGVRSVFDADNMLHSTAFTFNEFFETMSKSSQGQYRKETTTNNKFSIKQENNGQQQLSSIQSSSSSNDTPTKISALTEKEDIIHGQEVQATDDMPPLASLLSCFVRIVKCQNASYSLPICNSVVPIDLPSTMGRTTAGIIPYLDFFRHWCSHLRNISINQITTMRKKQLKIFEDGLYLNCVLCHTLPKTFNDIPIATYQNLFGNEANKIMQKLKRHKLNDQLKSTPLPSFEEILTMVHTSEQAIPSFTYTQVKSRDWESLLTNDGNLQTNNSPHPQQPTTQQSTFIQRILPELDPEHAELTFKQKKKIHNQLCTLKQHHRYYRHELTFRDIDHRFSIQQIKDILRQNDISFYAVNISISTTTNTKTLYVDIRDPS